MPHHEGGKGKPPPSSAKSSSAGLEKRKHSQKGSHSAKTSPAREMAPFFSIFYRGITKVSRSQSKSDLDGGREGGGQRGGGDESDRERMDRAQTSRKFADKPPMPSKSKNIAGEPVAHRKSAGNVTGRSRSTVDLAKEKAAAEGRTWREEPSSPDLRDRDLKKINSAPNSPQATRRWPFGGRLSFAKTHSPELVPPPPPKGPMENGHHPGGAEQNGHHKQNGQNGHAVENGEKVPKSGKKSSLQHAAAAPSTSYQTFQSFPGPQKPPSGPPQPPQPMSFAQRIKLHKGVRTGKLPVDALKQNQRLVLMNGHGQPQHYVRGASIGAAGGGGGNVAERTAAALFGRRRTAGGKKVPMTGAGVYMSADAIHELSQDPDYIAEALRTLGDEQPKVARSTPKHAYISQDPKRIHDRLRRDCLYTEDVYDKMVKDSLLVCELLQNHLDDVITGVRARSPTALSSPFTTPPGSPFMARSTSMQLPGRGGASINRVTISISPMAQQANPSPSPRPSGSSLAPPFPTTPPPSSPRMFTPLSPPPLVRVTPASFRGAQFGSPRSEKRLQFVS